MTASIVSPSSPSSPTELSSSDINDFLLANLTESNKRALDGRAASLHFFLSSFFKSAAAKHCPGIAFITSGGTTVPLELTAVRFLTNFSSGTRGARLTECYVQQGWLCVLLRHHTATVPFRHLLLEKLSTASLMRGVLEACADPAKKDDAQREETTAAAAASSTAAEKEKAEERASIFSPEAHAVAQLYAQRHHLLHEVEFDTIIDYLYLLREVALVLTQRFPANHSIHRTPLVFYASAAASDYFLPLQDRWQEKISGGEALTLHLPAVPKTLGHLRSEWLFRPHAPSSLQTFFVTFKLETSLSAMHEKAKKNLHGYHCDAVVANMLQSYKKEVWIYEKNQETAVDPAYLTIMKKGSTTTTSSSSASLLFRDCIEFQMVAYFRHRLESSFHGRPLPPSSTAPVSHTSKDTTTPVRKEEKHDTYVDPATGKRDSFATRAVVATQAAVDGPSMTAIPLVPSIQQRTATFVWVTELEEARACKNLPAQCTSSGSVIENETKRNVARQEQGPTPGTVHPAPSTTSSSSSSSLPGITMHFLVQRFSDAVWINVLEDHEKCAGPGTVIRYDAVDGATMAQTTWKNEGNTGGEEAAACERTPQDVSTNGIELSQCEANTKRTEKAAARKAETPGALPGIESPEEKGSMHNDDGVPPPPPLPPGEGHFYLPGNNHESTAPLWTPGATEGAILLGLRDHPLTLLVGSVVARAIRGCGESRVLFVVLNVVQTAMVLHTPSQKKAFLAFIQDTLHSLYASKA